MTLPASLARRSLTLLHLSDPQFGRHHRDQSGATDADREHDTLRARLLQDLIALREGEDPVHPELVIVTGDLSEWARRSEMAQFETFATQLLEGLGLPPERLVIVPGNHDVSWKACEAYFAQSEAEECTPKAPYWPKWRFYAELFGRLYGGPQAPFEFNEARPWSLFVYEPLHTVVAGLNSTMPETHRDGDHYGQLGEDQLRWFAEQLRPFAEQGWLRIAALHHNVQRKAKDDDENLRDAERLERLLGDHVNLVLHGHTHDGKLGWLRPQIPIVSTGSAAVKDVARPHGVPCQYQLLRVHEGGLRRWTRAYQPAQDRWVGDTAASVDGNEWRHEHPVSFTALHGVFPQSPPSEDDAPEPPRFAPRPPAGATGSPPGDDFLSQLSEICRLRDTATEVVRRHKGPPFIEYLELRRHHGEHVEMVPVGGHEDGVDEARLAAFIQRVAEPYRQRDQGVRPIFVHGGPPADPALVERARAAGVWLRSYEQYCGLIDFRRYRAHLATRLARDRVYPPDKYVGQRMVEHLGRQEQRHEDALATVRSWLDDEHGRFVLVLGTFGTGKTFLLRELARTLAQEDGAAMPILVEMRTLEKGLRLEQLLAQHFALHDVEDYNPARFMRMLEDGRVVLLFDGFDELVVRSTYARAAEHFETIVSAARGRAKVVVTSRRQHFLSDHQAKEAVRQVLLQKVEAVPGHRVVTLLPFEDDQIERFLAWHLGDVEQARERMRLIAKVRDLSGLSANPRMLGFIAALTEDELRAARDQRGSVSAAGLYRSLLDRWLAFEQDRRHPRGAAPGLTIDARWRAVTELAVRLWTRGEHQVGVAELEDIGAVLMELARSSKEEAGFQIGSGTLLVRDEGGRFSFIHESVLEWLVARAAAEALALDEAPALLGRGKMSQLLADFLIDLAGSEAAERWSSRALGTNLGNATADNALLMRQRLVAAGLVTDEETSTDVDLSHQELRGSDLSGQRMPGARLMGTDLRGANLRGIMLAGAQLPWALLRGADLTGADLRRADLSEADLRGASLLGAHLENARLHKTDLRRAKLLGASLDPAHSITSARTEGAALPDARVEPLLARGFTRVSGLAFSADADLLVVHDDHQLRVWDTETGRELRRLPHASTEPLPTRVEGFELVRGDGTGPESDESLLHRVWDWEPGQLDPPPDLVSPSGTISVAWSQQRLEINTGVGTQVVVDLPRPISQVAFADDGHLVVLFHDGLVQVWTLDPIAGADLDVVRRPVVGMAVHRGHILLALEDQQLLLYTRSRDARSQVTAPLPSHFSSQPLYEPPRTIGAPARPPITALASVSDSGLSIVVDQRLLCVTTTQRITPTLLALAHADRGVLSRDGLGLATGRGRQLTIHRFLPFEGRTPVSLHHTLDEPPALLGFAGRGSGRVLVATDGERSRIQELRILDTDHHDGLVHRGTVARAVAMSSSPDGRWIAVACSDHALWVISPLSREVLAPPIVLKGHQRSITALDLGGPGPQLVSASADGTVRLWDLMAGKQHHAWRMSLPHAVAFGPDGLVAAGGLGGQLALWDTTSFDLVAQRLGHDGPVTHLAFPARTLLATGSADGTVKLWRLPSLALQVTMAPLPEGWVAFAPDGRYKSGGRVSGQLWHCAALCRFEVGELDELVPGLRIEADGHLVEAE